MTKELKKEIKRIIKELELNCSIKKFKDNVDWICISQYQKLSEEFIEKFQDKVDWYDISKYQKLSEEFIEKFKNNVDWICISKYQHLSETFIEKFQNKVDWDYISAYQKLSETFIEKFKNKVNWDYISIYQKLSEELIKKFQDKVDWYGISKYQNLSETFIEKFQNKINITIQTLTHTEPSRKDKIKDIKKYSKKFNLKFDGEYLYAFRKHNKWNRGVWNKNISYDKIGRYEDWHCDFNKHNKNSFGLGIFSKGNVKVKVSIEDFGIWIPNTNKCRCKAFEIIDLN
jgi:phage anti-repressor protein